MISSNLISNYKFTRMLFENWVEIINWKRKSSSLYRLIRLWLYDWFILTPVKFANRCPTTREFSEDFEIFFVNSFWFTYMINIRMTRTRKRSARKSSVFSPFMKKLKSSLLKKIKSFLQGSDRQCMVLDLRMQYLRKSFKDSFETYKTFIIRILEV